MTTRTAILMLLALAAFQIGRAEDQAADSDIPVSTKSIHPKVLHALGRGVTFDFQETPLRDVVAFVRDYTGLNVILDAASLERAGVAEDAPVTLALDGAPLGDALEMLLEPLELGLVARGEVLVVTDADAARRPEVRIYPISDLVRVAADARAKTWLGERYVEQLLQAIVSSIEPEGWQAAGGRADVHFSPAAEALIVSAGQSAHRKIGDFLVQLRRAKELSGRLAADSGLPPWSEMHAEFADSSPRFPPPKRAPSARERRELAEAVAAEVRAEIAKIKLESLKRKRDRAPKGDKPAS